MSQISIKIDIEIYDDPIYCSGTTSRGMRERCEQMSAGGGYCSAFPFALDPLDYDYDSERFKKKEDCAKAYRRQIENND